MTIEEVTELINQLREKIPQMQVQLHQAEGYRQALVDIQNKKLERKKTYDYELGFVGLFLNSTRTHSDTLRAQSTHTPAHTRTTQ